jgi:voltage-gated potassium channel Kch
MINDPRAVQRIVDTIRRVAPPVQIIVRTHYEAEQSMMRALGADRVVVEETEGGLEILVHVMRSLGLPRNVIDAEVRRARTTASERDITVPRNRWPAQALAALPVESISRCGPRRAPRSSRSSGMARSSTSRDPMIRC